ncbi:MAG: SpoIIE family protein phosphatase [Acidobacteria bacterium]|nr:SpoIIE family protein phosphatase [Acidobacteriota bacterium]
MAASDMHPSGFASRSELVTFMMRLRDLISSHDLNGLLECYAENAVMISPVFGEVKGLEAIARSWHTIFANYPDWSVNVTDVLVDGNRVAALGSNSAIDSSGWFGLPPTGKSISYRAVILLTFANRKIARDERLYDLPSLLDRLEKLRIEGELRLAAEVQGALLSRATHIGSHYEAAADSVACRTIGGDFFELIDLSSGTFGMLLGDVAGKGPPAALLAAMLQGGFTAEAQITSRPAAALARMNHALGAKSLDARFATLVYGLLTPDGHFLYSNAGHNPPFIIGHAGIRRLTVGGPVLGALPEAEYLQESVALDPGDVIVMFSDGVTEAEDALGNEFGEERLVALATAHRGRPAQEIARAVLRAVSEFTGGKPPADDITVAIAKFQ